RPRRAHRRRERPAPPPAAAASDRVAAAAGVVPELRRRRVRMARPRSVGLAERDADEDALGLRRAGGRSESGLPGRAGRTGSLARASGAVYSRALASAAAAPAPAEAGRKGAGFPRASGLAQG